VDLGSKIGMARPSSSGALTRERKEAPIWGVEKLSLRGEGRASLSRQLEREAILTHQSFDCLGTDFMWVSLLVNI
jgi:hypothetical protein